MMQGSRPGGRVRHESGFRIDAVPLLRLAGVAGGTRVLTPRGEVAIEALRRGDRVVTRGGALPVIGAEARAARVAPVRVTPEALGIGMPGRDLILGPSTRLWLPRQSRPVDARALADGSYVVAEEPRWIVLWTLAFRAPQVVRAEGVEVCT